MLPQAAVVFSGCGLQAHVQSPWHGTVFAASRITLEHPRRVTVLAGLDYGIAARADLGPCDTRQIAALQKDGGYQPR
jgi:hypothetical protein